MIWVVLVVVLVLTSCGVSDQPNPNDNCTLPIVGGCHKVVYAANADWTEVVEVTLREPDLLTPGEPTKLDLGAGFSGKTYQRNQSLRLLV